MPVSSRLNVRDYYDLTPPVALTAGDIWSNLPTFGLLPGGATRAIVITPACDLSNRKVATASYLPIIPVRQYFLSPPFVPTIRREADRHLRDAGLQPLPPPDTPFVPPPIYTIDATLHRCTYEGSPPPNNRRRNAATRASAALRLLRACHRLDGDDFPGIEFTTAFGAKQWKSTVRNIVQNSHRMDLFFLPSDREPADWSAIPEPSVVLFRYPLAAPIQLLECAQDVQLQNWQAVIDELRPLLPGIDAFATRPLKRATLRSGFLGDLLTRFVSMHVRLGAPDLSEATVDTLVNNITAVVE